LINYKKLNMPVRASKPQIFLWIVVTILLLTSVPVALFLFEEWQREKLLHIYSSAAASENFPMQSGVWDTKQLLQSNEVLACVIGSYGSAEDLIELNTRQKMSLPKSKLPSQDGSWYLLYFSEQQVERIALHPGIKSNVAFANQSCGDQASNFSILPRPASAGGSELVISFLHK
jgi:hypothetical protein